MKVGLDQSALFRAAAQHANKPRARPPRRALVIANQKSKLKNGKRPYRESNPGYRR